MTASSTRICYPYGRWIVSCASRVSVSSIAARVNTAVFVFLCHLFLCVSECRYQIAVGKIIGLEKLICRVIILIICTFYVLLDLCVVIVGILLIRLLAAILRAARNS